MMAPILIGAAIAGWVVIIEEAGGAAVAEGEGVKDLELGAGLVLEQPLKMIPRTTIRDSVTRKYLFILVLLLIS